MKSVLAAAGAVLVVAQVWAAQPVPLPARLSDTGLFVSGTTPGLNGVRPPTVDSRNRRFSPQYPLWTDGAHKTRWIQLPAGTSIDARELDNWQFPVGTKLWKEFAFNGRRVETRMSWRVSADQWVFGTYLWNADQTDATLAPEEGVRDVVEVEAGKRHSIPSRDDCRACHDNGRPVLGFTALQLSDDRDPLAPHAEALTPGTVTLRTLIAKKLVTRPQGWPAHPPRIPGDARTRAVLGYFTGNCGHCHNEESRTATVRYPLLMPAYATLSQVHDVIGTLRTRTTGWDLPHADAGTTTLVKAGAPELSAALARMRSRRPSSQMPPLGTVVADREAIDLVSAWIAALAEGAQGAEGAEGTD